MSGNFRKKKIALAGALMFVVTSVSAQTVKGVVTDNTGEPIIGASVMEVGVAGSPFMPQTGIEPVLDLTRTGF